MVVRDVGDLWVFFGDLISGRVRVRVRVKFRDRVRVMFSSMVSRIGFSLGLRFALTLA